MAQGFDAGSIYSKMVLGMDSWSTGVAKVQKDTAKMSKNFSALGGKLSKLGGQLTRNLTLPLVGIGVLAFKASKDLNKAMASVGTLIPNQTEKVLKYKKAVQDMSIQYGKSSTDIADGLYQVISAYGDTDDALKILETTVKASVAGQTQTVDSLNLLSAVTKGYGDVSAESVKKASDLAFLTVKLGQTTFPELANSMGRVIPVAKAMNVKQEEMFAVMSTLTGVTGKANEVSTQFAGILRALIKPTDGMKKAIKDLKYKSAEALITENGLVKSMRMLIGQTDKSKESIGKLFRRTEALTAVFALTGGQADVFDEKLNNMKKSSGKTDEAFKEMTEGVNKSGFKWEQLKQKVIQVAQNLGDTLAPALVDIFDALSPIFDTVVELIKGFSKLPGPVKSITGAFAGLMIVAGPIMKIAGGMISIFSKLGGAIGLAKKALSFINPVVGATAVAGALVVGAIKAWDASLDKQIKKIKESSKQISTNIRLLREYKKTVSENEIAVLNTQIAMWQALGLSRGEAMAKVSKMLQESGKIHGTWSKEVSKSGKKVVTGEKKTSDTLVNILKGLNDKVFQMTNSEFEYRKQKAKETRDAIYKQLEIEKADKSAFNLADRAYNLELAEIQKEQTRVQKEEADKRKKTKKEELEKKAEAQQEYNNLMSEWQSEIDDIEGVKQEDKLTRLEDWKQTELNDLAERKLSYEQFTEGKKMIDDLYLARKKQIEGESQSDSLNKLKEMLKKSAKLVNMFVSGLSNIWNQYYKNQTIKLDNWYKKEKQAIDNSEMNEEEKSKALEKLDKEYDAKKTALQRKQATQEKAKALLGAITNTASAVAEALPNIPLAIIAGAMGAVQVALIASQPIPFAEGGMTKSEGMALLHPNEVITPFDKFQEMMFGGDDDEGGGGLTGGKNVVEIHVFTMDSKGIEETFREKLAPIMQEAFKNEDVYVYPSAVREY